MNQKLILVIGYLFLSSQILAQGFYYNFDNCDLVDSNVQAGDLTSVNDTICDCGVVDQSLVLDGFTDTFFMPKMNKEFFEQDFTFSFYFSPDISSGNQALFAIQDSCNRDSIFSIRYLASVNQLEVNVAENLGKNWSSRGDLKEDACWHRVVLTKEGNIYNFYLDNEFVEQFDFFNPFPFPDISRVYIGSSPCVANNDIQFAGKIDEIFLDDRAWTFNEIKASDFYPDQIISQDTTIFLGNSVEIMTGSNCATSFFWSPLEDIEDEDTTMPTVSPEETTFYFFETTQANCSTIDSIRINVVDESLLDCSDLLLPNVFTPNSDNVNDIFEISNPFIIDELLSFEIFDRYGAIVFKGEFKSSGWDGKYKDEDLMLGMYLYRIEYICQGEEIAKQGSFSLMR